MTNRQRGGINEANAAAVSHGCPQIKVQGHPHPRDQAYETIVADQFGELIAQMALDITDVKCLKITITALMKKDQDGHDLAFAQIGLTLPLNDVTGQHLLLPPGSEKQPEIIDITEQLK